MNWAALLLSRLGPSGFIWDHHCWRRNGYGPRPPLMSAIRSDIFPTPVNNRAREVNFRCFSFVPVPVRIVALSLSLILTCMQCWYGTRRCLIPRAYRMLMSCWTTHTGGPRPSSPVWRLRMLAAIPGFFELQVQTSLTSEGWCLWILLTSPISATCTGTCVYSSSSMLNGRQQPSSPQQQTELLP